MDKYIKPHSLTWWTSVTPLLLGLFIALESVHGLTSVIEVISEATGGMSAYTLINAGLVGIGLRGAIQ